MVTRPALPLCVSVSVSPPSGVRSKPCQKLFESQSAAVASNHITCRNERQALLLRPVAAAAPPPPPQRSPPATTLPRRARRPRASQPHSCAARLAFSQLSSRRAAFPSHQLPVLLQSTASGCRASVVRCGYPQPRHQPPSHVPRITHVTVATTACLYSLALQAGKQQRLSPPPLPPLP